MYVEPLLPYYSAQSSASAECFPLRGTMFCFNWVGPLLTSVVTKGLNLGHIPVLLRNERVYDVINKNNYLACSLTAINDN